MNTKLKEAMKYMDQKYIDEAVEYKAKTRSHKPLVRWGAIAACLVLMVSLSFGYFGGHFTQPQEEIILPPVRFGSYEADASLERCYSLIEAYQEAEAVALIRIGNWQKETKYATLYQAEVITCYKGGIEGTINFKQDGSSHHTFKYYPLYTYGNEVLVFMNKGMWSEDTEEGEATEVYYSIGAYTSDLIVVRDSSGKAYIPGGFFLDLMLEPDNITLNPNIGITDDLYQRYIAADPEMKTRTNGFSEAYALEELVSQFYVD